MVGGVGEVVKTATTKSAAARSVAVSVLLTLVFSSGCATHRFNQFRTFSSAGVAYTKANQTVIQEAGKVAIRADSAILIKSRADLGSDDRRQTVIQHNADLKNRVLVLEQLNEHARLLQSYFQTLADMADTKAPETLAGSAKSLYDAVAAIGRPLQTASIGQQKVSSFIPQVTSIVVKNLKTRALNKELHDRSAAIERELAIQEAALTALSQDLKANYQIILNIEENQKVVASYVADARLPDNWADSREELLTRSATVENAATAIVAAKKLRQAFAALVSGDLSLSIVNDLVQDADEIVNLAGKLRGSSAH